MQIWAKLWMTEFRGNYLTSKFLKAYSNKRMLCPKCQKESPEGSQFCVHCGTAFNQTQPTQPVKVSEIATNPVSQPTSSSPSKVILITGIGLGLALLAVIIGIGIYFTLIKKPSTSILQPATTPSPTTQDQSSPSPTPEPTTSPQAIQTVGTEFTGVEASLTKITRGTNVVTVNFTLTLTGAPQVLYSFREDGSGYTIIEGGKIEDGKQYYNDPYDLSSAYLVDDESQMKYEVVKGADDEPLCSVIAATELETEKSISLYAQFTAPPSTTKVVTINLPRVQPFVGIPLD